jgi:hypothetical protein
MAGKPQRGQTPLLSASPFSHTEQTPQWLSLSGIRHSQHKPGTVSIDNLLVKKENNNR